MAPKNAFYVPCLRWRLAERQALAELSDKAKDSVVPLITIPDLEFDFEDGTPNRWRHAADAEQLYTTLRNGNVPLVVLTACSTAAAAPNGQDYPGVAFESLAQALVEEGGALPG